MPFVPGLNVAEIDINQTLHGQRVQNTLYAVNFGGWTPGSLELLAGEMITWVGTQLYADLSFQLQLTEVLVRDLTVADGPQFTGVPTVPVLGQDLGNASPGNVAACVSFRTGLAGRSRRGRNYVPGIPEAQTNGNQISPALGASLVAAYNGLLSPTGPMAVSGASWVVFSRITAGDPRPVGQPTLVTGVIVDPNVDSQRRRLTGRGT